MPRTRNTSPPSPPKPPPPPPPSHTPHTSPPSPPAHTPNRHRLTPTRAPHTSGNTAAGISTTKYEIRYVRSDVPGPYHPGNVAYSNPAAGAPPRDAFTGTGATGDSIDGTSTSRPPTKLAG